MATRTTISALAFALGLVAIDCGIGNMLDRALSSVTTGDGSGGLVNWTLANTDVDYLAFGSSRVRHHLDPAIIEVNAGLSGINVGLDGQYLPYAVALQSLVLQHGTQAKLFILELDPDELCEPTSGRELLLAPFYGRAQSADAVLEAASSWASVKLLSRTYRYNSKAPSIAANLAAPRPVTRRGFSPLQGRLDTLPEPNNQPTQYERPVRPERVALLRTFLRQARTHGIEVVLVTAPRLRPEMPGPGTSEYHANEVLRQLAAEFQVSHIPLTESEYPTFRDPKLFKDTSHLNADGAQLFSELLAYKLAARRLPLRH